jgi:hypothetical protein
MTIATIVGAVFALIGAALLVYGVRSVWLGMASASWPATDGEVSVSDLQRDYSGSSVTYRAEVAYKYQVGDRQLIADRVFFGDGLSTSWATGALRETVKYQVGSRVRVRYDPKDPECAVLEPGTNGAVYFLIVFALLFVGAGIAALLGRFGH